jgi:hypothetical protein
MKKILTTMVLIAMVLSANAQRIYPMRECNQQTYTEVIELIDKIEKLSYIEKMEHIELNCDMMRTYGGEIEIRKQGNKIEITHLEFTDMLRDIRVNPHRQHYDINAIKTELYIQNVHLFEYISGQIYNNRNVKNMYIATDQKIGAPHIYIEYYHL